MLVLIYLISQIIGLYIAGLNMDYNPDTQEYEYPELALGVERLDVSPEYSPVILIGAILLGTAIILILIKIRAIKVIKVWFFLAIFVSLLFAFKSLTGNIIGLILALILTIWSIYKPNIYIQNITQIFIYSGIAALLINILMPLWIAILLIGISIYDMIAVWKIKHMIVLANFQTSQNMFAGAMIPYSTKKVTITKHKIAKKQKGKSKRTTNEAKVAILGGGDMAFPLLFAVAIMKESIITATFFQSMLIALIPVITSTITLACLLFLSKKNKFYPAMPFITIGCMIGWGITFLI